MIEAGLTQSPSRSWPSNPQCVSQNQCKFWMKSAELWSDEQMPISVDLVGRAVPQLRPQPSVRETWVWEAKPSAWFFNCRLTDSTFLQLNAMHLRDCTQLLLSITTQPANLDKYQSLGHGFATSSVRCTEAILKSRTERQEGCRFRNTRMSIDPGQAKTNLFCSLFNAGFWIRVDQNNVSLMAVIFPNPPVVQRRKSCHSKLLLVLNAFLFLRCSQMLFSGQSVAVAKSRPQKASTLTSKLQAKNSSTRNQATANLSFLACFLSWQSDIKEPCLVLALADLRTLGGWAKEL